MNDPLQSSLTNASNTSAILVEKLLPKILLGCLLSSLSIFTVCGNILVLYALRTEKHLRTVSNLFILSLAVADLAVGLFVMPFSATTIIAGRWTFSSVVCKMWLSIDYVARYFERESHRCAMFIFCFLARRVYSISFFLVSIVIGLLFILYVICESAPADERQYLFL